MVRPTTIENKALAITKDITNKGFSGMPSVSLASSFVSVDSDVAPISLTGHSLSRYVQIVRKPLNK